MEKSITRRLKRAKAKTLCIQQQVNSLAMKVYENMLELEILANDAEVQAIADSEEAWVPAIVRTAREESDSAADYLTWAHKELAEAAGVLNHAATIAHKTED